MPAYEYQPHELLAPFIHSFCYIERHFVAPNTTFTVLPDSMIEMIWNVGAECSLVLPEYTAPLPSCYIVGLLDQPLCIAANGLVQIVRARFYPWGLLPLMRTLLQPTAAHRRGGLLWVSAALHLAPQPVPFQSSDNGAQAVAQAQHILLNHAGATLRQDQVAIQAAQTLRTHNGDIGINMLAHRLGLAERSLRRTFQTTLQTSPKAFARLVRFEYVRDTLWRAPATPFADIAFDAGYSDQAHMQREFRRFSKRTPGQFVSDMQELRSLLTVSSDRNLQDA